MSNETESMTLQQLRDQHVNEVHAVQDYFTKAVMSVQENFNGDTLAFGMAIVLGRVAGNCAANCGETEESLLQRMEGLFDGIKHAALREMASSNSGDASQSQEAA